MNPSQHPAFDNHEGVHWFEDAASGLRAIIAIHSTHSWVPASVAVAGSGAMPTTTRRWATRCGCRRA